MSPEQCRAARAFLGWSMDELAEHAHCSNSTVRDFEAGRRTPHENRLKGIQQALEAAGMAFSVEAGGMQVIAGKPRPAEPRAVPVEKKAAPRDRQRKPRGAKKRT